MLTLARSTRIIRIVRLLRLVRMQEIIANVPGLVGSGWVVFWLVGLVVFLGLVGM